LKQLKNLLKKNSYKDCEKALVKGIFDVSREEFLTNCSANRLNPNAKNPIVKLRIAYNKGKSASFRLYFFAIIKEEKLYFGHLYPKTGVKGQEVLSQKEENEVIKSLLSDVKSGSTKEVYLDITKNKIAIVSITTRFGEKYFSTFNIHCFLYNVCG